MSLSQDQDGSGEGGDAPSGKIRIDREALETGPEARRVDREDRDARRERQEALTSDAVHQDPSPRDSKPSAGLAPGTVIGERYSIEEQLGLGGHGSVHRATHLGLDLPVAVKVLALDALGTADHHHIVERFSREARMLARIRHRNVLAVHDTGTLPDGSPYLVVELVEGEDLDQRIRRAPLSIAAVVDLGRQLFGALTALADAGVEHRDVKPSNVMLRRESDDRVHVKLIDFGIAHGPDEGARLTVPGQILGTPHYMSPEQLRGEPLDVRSDLYGACAVLYEALTRKPPFDGPTAPVVIGQILAAKLVPVRSLRDDCPEALAELIERGLAKKRIERPSHPLAVVAAVDAIVHDVGLPTGALAWAEEPIRSRTPPVTESAPRKTPPDGTPEPPEEEPMPLDPETEEPPMPEVPGHIQDPPSRRFPSPGGVLLAGVLGIAIGLGFSPAGRGASALLLRPEESTAIAQAPAPPVEPPPPVTPADDEGRVVTSLLDEGLEAFALGHVEIALAHYREACERDPDRAEAFRGRGLAAARAGLGDEAISAFEHYLSLAPDASDAERVRERLDNLRMERAARMP